MVDLLGRLLVDVSNIRLLRAEKTKRRLLPMKRWPGADDHTNHRYTPLTLQTNLSLHPLPRTFEKRTVTNKNKQNHDAPTNRTRRYKLSSLVSSKHRRLSNLSRCEDQPVTELRRKRSVFLLGSDGAPRRRGQLSGVACVASPTSWRSVGENLAGAELVKSFLPTMQRALWAPGRPSAHVQWRTGFRSFLGMKALLLSRLLFFFFSLSSSLTLFVLK